MDLEDVNLVKRVYGEQYERGRMDAAREIGAAASMGGFSIRELTDGAEWLAAAAKTFDSGYGEGKHDERERQYDLIMSCLPIDAENLSTLTPEQALKLVRKFVKLKPWGSNK